MKDSTIIKDEKTKEAEEMEFRERKRWLFFGLPFTFTKYIIKEDMITIDSGLLKTVENDCYMYKVQDVQHVASLVEKIFRLGTIICYTGHRRRWIGGSTLLYHAGAPGAL